MPWRHWPLGLGVGVLGWVQQSQHAGVVAVQERVVAATQHGGHVVAAPLGLRAIDHADRPVVEHGLRPPVPVAGKDGCTILTAGGLVQHRFQAARPGLGRAQCHFIK